VVLSQVFSVLISGVIVVVIVIVVFSMYSDRSSDVPVHIGTPRPRATATDQLEADSTNDVLYRRG
jgi:hypothetical protein